MHPRFVTKDPVQSRRGSPLRLTALATFIVDQRGRITQWSGAAEEMFGRSQAEATGRFIGELLIHEEDRGRVSEALAHVVVGRRWIGVLAARCSGGSVEEIEFRWEPIVAGDATIVVVSAYPSTPLRIGEAGASQERLALLNEASRRIGSALDVRQTARELMEVAVPRFADSGGVLVRERLLTDHEFPERDTDGEALVRRIAVAVADTNTAEWAEAFPVDEVTTYPSWTPYAQCMATARSILFGEMDTATAQEIALHALSREAAARVLDRTSKLVVPLPARGRVLGFAVFARKAGGHPFEEQDIALAEELAARAAVCIDNACLYHRERRTALTLQSSLLPADLDTPLGLEIAHRYLPASDMTMVGGDWFDVISLAASRVALVVGDVMGHGTRAAATMGQLRTAVRTLASLDLPPAEVLYRLDQMTQDLDATQIATCVYATYDPVTRECSIARAGHVPPIVIGPDGTSDIVEVPSGLPLGIGGEPFEARDLTLEPDSTLVLCTDGLVESRERDIDVGLWQLGTALTTRGHCLEEICDSAIEVLSPDEGRDDIALLVARVLPLTDDQTAAWRFDPEPRTPGKARLAVKETLVRWELGDLADTTELIISELVTNAIRHGSGPVEVRLLRGQTLLCQVGDSSSLTPVIRTPGLTDDVGRGMQLVARLTQRWGSRVTRMGKIVWCEQAIPEHLRPASRKVECGQPEGCGQPEACVEPDGGPGSIPEGSGRPGTEPARQDVAQEASQTDPSVSADVA